MSWLELQREAAGQLTLRYQQNKQKEVQHFTVPAHVAHNFPTNSSLASAGRSDKRKIANSSLPC